MTRLAILLGLLIAGTADPVAAQLNAPMPVPAPQQRYDLNYYSSDERIQAFDDGRTTRLLLPEGTLIPMVISLKPQGEVMLPMLKEPPYLVLDGLHSTLILNWANQRKVTISYRGQHALERRSGDPAAFGGVAPAATYGQAPRPVAAAPAAGGPRPLATVFGEAPAVPTAPAVPIVQAPVAAPPPPPPAPPPPVFEIVRSDRNFREALGRWSKAAGWVHEAEHWTVPFDISVAGADAFTGDFRAAVRALLATTGVNGTPLKPCFHSNRVLRVVLEAQPCDKSAADVRASAANATE